MSVRADMREALTGGAKKQKTPSRVPCAAALPFETKTKNASGSQSFQKPRVMTYCFSASYMLRYICSSSI